MLLPPGYTTREADAAARIRAQQKPLEGLPPQGTTLFFMDSPDQEQEVLNSSVVPFSKAIEVANEFLFSEEMPRAIKWFEL